MAENLLVFMLVVGSLVAVATWTQSHLARPAARSMVPADAGRRGRKILGVTLLVLGLIGVALAVVVHAGMQNVYSTMQSDPELQLRLALAKGTRSNIDDGLGTAMAVKYIAGGVGTVLALIGLVLLLTLPERVVRAERSE